MRTITFLVVAALAVLSGCDGGSSAGGGGSGATITPMSCGSEPVIEGKATYYDFADGSGACSFDATPNDLLVGAMNFPDYQASGACGACVAIDGPDGSVTVRIVDLCPECESGHIDLSPEAFSKVADLSLGVVPISWSYVSCGYSSPIRYKFKEGSNQWWTAVQIRDHNQRIDRFEYESDGAWVEVQRTDYNYFVEEQGMGPGPYHFRVTDVLGQTLEDDGVPFAEAGIMDGATQFPPCDK